MYVWGRIKTRYYNSGMHFLYFVRQPPADEACVGGWMGGSDCRKDALLHVWTDDAFGRRYGFQGRLYNHAIVVENQLWADGDMLRGWAFVPQEGCTILSTLAAFAHQTECLGAAGLAALASRYLFTEV